jgi:hypothetical protein
MQGRRTFFLQKVVFIALDVPEKACVLIAEAKSQWLMAKS